MPKLIHFKDLDKYYIQIAHVLVQLDYLKIREIAQALNLEIENHPNAFNYLIQNSLI